jgi:hypothetical protein
VKEGGVLAEPEVSFSKRMQIADPYVLAELHPRAPPGYGDGQPTERFVLLDMRTGSTSTYASEDLLRTAAAMRGVTLALEPAYDVYSRHIFSWFSVLFLLLALVPAAVALVFHFHRLTYPAEPHQAATAALGP